MSLKRTRISLRARFAVLSASGFRCQYCGRRAPEAVLQVDHIIPLAAGGTNDQRNLIAACTACNLGKGVTEVTSTAVTWTPVRPGQDSIPISGRCPGEQHPGPYSETLYGGPYGPTCVPMVAIALMCEACKHLVAVRSLTPTSELVSA